MNRFDKPFRIAPSFDTKKNIEMFNLALNLDTHELLQHSLINQTSFDICCSQRIAGPRSFLFTGVSKIRLLLR